MFFAVLVFAIDGCVTLALSYVGRCSLCVVCCVMLAVCSWLCVVCGLSMLAVCFFTE